MLREFAPTFLATFTWRFALGIASPEARAALAIAPTPAEASKLSVSRIAAALRRAGRGRNIGRTAAEIRAELCNPQLRQPLLVEVAMGKQAPALLAALDTACASVEDLGQAAAELSRRGRLDRRAGARVTRASGRSPVDHSSPHQKQPLGDRHGAA